MSPQSRIPPLPPLVAAMIRDITEAWHLEFFLDALPRRLNPGRNNTKDVMTWGVEFITRLRDLALLTRGRHDGVVTALNQRVDQKYTEARPDGAQWTIIIDIDELIRVNTLLPAAAAPQVSQNPPRRIARLAGTRRSQRIADHAASETALAATSRADGGNAAPSAAGGASTAGRGKRRREQENNKTSVDNGNVGSGKRARLLKENRQVRSPNANEGDIVDEQQEEEVNVQPAVQQGATFEGANHIQVAAAQEDNNAQIVAPQENDNIQVVPDSRGKQRRGSRGSRRAADPRLRRQPPSKHAAHDFRAAISSSRGCISRAACSYAPGTEAAQFGSSGSGPVPNIRICSRFFRLRV
jgi:hypothetical protein